MLHDFVVAHREEIIRRCRAKVMARSVPPPTKAEVEHGVPVFLDQLVNALRHGQRSNPEINNSALLHEHDLLQQGFTVAQVVHDYGDVCQSITELAGELSAPVDADEFRALNHCLDDAISGAVTQFAHERNQSDVNEEITRGNERLEFFGHELRTLINIAIVAFGVLEPAGNVGAAAITGTTLRRSLVEAIDLIGRSLGKVPAHEWGGFPGGVSANYSARAGSKSPIKPA